MFPAHIAPERAIRRGAVAASSRLLVDQPHGTDDVAALLGDLDIGPVPAGLDVFEELPRDAMPACNRRSRVGELLPLLVEKPGIVEYMEEEARQGWTTVAGRRL